MTGKDDYKPSIDEMFRSVCKYLVVIDTKLLRIEALLATSSPDSNIREWGDHLVKFLRNPEVKKLSDEQFLQLLSCRPSVKEILTNPFSALNRSPDQIKGGNLESTD